MAKKKSTPTKTVSTPSEKRPTLSWIERPRLVAIGLVLLSIGMYANTLGHGFVLDDAIVLTENGIVKQGIKGWGELFSNDTFFGFFDENKSLVAGGRYRPLTPALFGLERLHLD